MEKEIFEQPEVISQVLGFYLNASEEKLTLPALPKSSQIKRILLVGCGTAFYSCLIAKYWFESISGVPTHAELASEFRYRSPVVKKDDLLVFVSQSGETADTIGALRFAKEHTKNILAIVNVEQSSIARESTWVFPTKAGPEIGVASTKAFICQLIILQILNIKLSSDLFKTTSEQRSNLLKGLLELPRLYSEVLSQNENIKKLCKKFSRAHSVLFLGRDVLYPIALEGALKLKEISYIHAEGHASGELKHGPIALIDKNMSVVALNPSTKVYEKTSSNLEEVKARSGKIILLTDKKGKDLSKNLTKSIFQLPTCSDSVVPILYALPLQLIAYYTALYKGTDVDQPRNLAKPVVFCGFFPVDSSEFESLRESIEKLALNDSSFTFEIETSLALGFGFRCGFLGLLHLEVIRERIEREFNIDLITTAPSVVYSVETIDNKLLNIHNPADLPDPSKIKIGRASCRERV